MLAFILAFGMVTSLTRHHHDKRTTPYHIFQGQIACKNKTPACISFLYIFIWQGWLSIQPITCTFNSVFFICILYSAQHLISSQCCTYIYLTFIKPSSIHYDLLQITQLITMTILHASNDTELLICSYDRCVNASIHKHSKTSIKSRYSFNPSSLLQRFTHSA